MKRLLKIIGLAVLTVAAAIVGLSEALDYRNQAEFNAVVWRNALKCGYDGCDAECTRGHMVRDLTWKYLNPGISRSEVVALLGAADSPPAAKSLSYSLGMCSGFRMDYDSLVLLFDDRDALIGSRTVQH